MNQWFYTGLVVGIFATLLVLLLVDILTSPTLLLELRGLVPAIGLTGPIVLGVLFGIGLIIREGFRRGK